MGSPVGYASRLQLVEPFLRGDVLQQGSFSSWTQDFVYYEPGLVVTLPAFQVFVVMEVLSIPDLLFPASEPF